LPHPHPFSSKKEKGICSVCFFKCIVNSRAPLSTFGWRGAGGEAKRVKSIIFAIMGSITDIVRKLRSQQTPAEKKLWQILRNRQFNGKKFKRQQPIIYSERQSTKHFFVPDFYCHEAKLVIELDGKIHDFQKDYDKERDFIIKEFGLMILRIKNEELEELDKVLNKIAHAIAENKAT